MMVVILVVGIVFLVYFLNWLLSSPYNYWNKRKIPHPEPSLLVGNLGASVTLSKNLGQIYKEIYDKYTNLSYVGIYKFRQPAIVLRDIELVKDVLIKHFPSFHDNDFYVNEKNDPIMYRNPFNLKGERWKFTRGIITSSITAAKLKSMFNLIDVVARNLILYIENEPNSTGGDGINAKELSAMFTTDVVASCAFGLEGKSFIDPDTEFRRMGRKVLEPSTINGIKHLGMFVFPILSKILPIKIVPQDVNDWFTAVIKETIEYRKKNGVIRNDYLDLLISVQNKHGSSKFDDLDVVAQAMTFYVDGFETSSIALSFMFYELASHPEFTSMLRAEIETVLANHDGNVSYDSVHEMTYLDCFVHESLRLHSPAVFMSKICTEPFDLPPPRGMGTGPNLTVEKGTPVIIPILGIHSDPAYYPNPEVFDPERFSEENKQTRPKCTFLGFGDGPRICLGSKFALAQIKAALIYVIRNFDIKVNKKTQEPLEIDSRSFLLAPVGGIWLNFYKRN